MPRSSRAMLPIVLTGFVATVFTATPDPARAHSSLRAIEVSRTSDHQMTCEAIAREVKALARIEAQEAAVARPALFSPAVATDDDALRLTIAAETSGMPAPAQQRRERLAGIFAARGC
jgi:hypothetical protein